MIWNGQISTYFFWKTNFTRLYKESHNLQSHTTRGDCGLGASSSSRPSHGSRSKSFRTVYRRKSLRVATTGEAKTMPMNPIKFARMRVLQLIHFKDRVISASRRSYRNRKFDPFQHFGSMNTHHNTSFNMVANEVHSSIGLESYRFRK